MTGWSIWYVAEQFAYEYGVADSDTTRVVLGMVMDYLAWGE